MEQNIQNLSSEVDIRREKVRKLKEQGSIPYVEKFERTCTIAQARELPDGEQLRVHEQGNL